LKRTVDSTEPLDEDKLGEMEDSLEALVDTVENIDNAKSFALVGGFPPLVKAIQNKDQVGLASKAIEVVSALVQNHPYCQEEAMKHDLISLLRSWIPDNDVDQEAKPALGKIAVKALSAVSALVRGYKPGEQHFKDTSGLALLIQCISTTSNPRMQRKALFMLRAVYLKDKEGAMLAAGEPGFVKVLTESCSSDDIDLRENGFFASVELLGHYPNSLLQFNQQSPTLQDIATRRMKEIREMDKDDRDQFYEELKVCLSIIMRCKKGLFHPTYEFQVVDQSLTVPGGLEINMSFEDGQNKARISEAWKFSTKVQWTDGKTDFVNVPVARHMHILEVRQLFSEKVHAPVDKVSMRAIASMETLSDTDTVETADLFNLGAQVTVSGSSVAYFEGDKSSSAIKSGSIFNGAENGSTVTASASDAETSASAGGSTGRGLRMSHLDRGAKNELMLLANK